MTFIRDYRQFIEVGCSSCGRKHTVQADKYSVTSQGYAFHSPISCSCGQTASTANKDKWTRTLKTENNEIIKKNKATTVKMMVVIGLVIVLFAGETIYMINEKETEQKSVSHETKKEVSAFF
ncbi:hypothetical protein [Paenibacillus sp. PL91]|uniref:hypothetical protein n=1 Tax=Paenibacillus sp. PL91 TaxID=2729538 RepID=UPI00145FAD38|nr:hypothetical protein [Paenibacillus sp. PL91]MBC9200284.1 hypothetical protein [Paenibacillus sp. PL91]